MTEDGGAGQGSTGTVVQDAPERCAWCRRRLPERAATGRPRMYCRRSCRQRAFEARRRLGELAWGEDRLIELRERQDDVQVAVAGLLDLVDELRADLDDSRPWSDEERTDVVDRLGALVGDLRS